MIMNAQFDLGGVVVATTLAFKEDPSAPAGLAVDYDKFAAHCDFLINNGCRGVGPNGSLGEYSSLTDAERRKVVQVAVETVAGRGLVVAGVHGVGWHQAKQWAEYAKEDGADGVLLLPPTIYRANRREIIEHYTRVNEVGLPIMLYNNPFDTKVDLTPDLVAELVPDRERRCRQGVQRRRPPGARDQGTLRHRRDRRRRRPAVRVAGGRRDRLVRRLPERVPEGGRRDLRPRPGRQDRRRPRTVRAAGRGRSAGIREPSSSRRSSSAIDIVGQSYGGPTRPPRGPLSPEQARHRRAGHPEGRWTSSPLGVEDSPVRSSRLITAVDSHTEGMPTRVVTGGVGVVPGATMNERRLYFMSTSIISGCS